MFGIFKRKNKNKDIDPVKEKQKLVNDSIKKSKKEKKKKKKKQPKIDRFDIRDAIPFTYDEEKNMFKDLQQFDWCRADLFVYGWCGCGWICS